MIRWALYRLVFSYKTEHIPGERSILLDITTRLLCAYRQQARNHCVCRRQLTAGECIVLTDFSATDTWPFRFVVP